MAAGTDNSLLNRRYLLIALLPTLVFGVSQVLLKYYGEPWDILPARLAEFEAYKEGAARMAVLGAFMLCFGAALAGLLFFAASLRRFGRNEAGLMITGFLMLAGAAVLTQQVVIGRPAEEYAGLRLFCLAAGPDPVRIDRAGFDEAAAPGADRARAARAAAQSRQPAVTTDVAAGRLSRQAKCPYPRFERIRLLLALQFQGTALAFAGLVFAGIFCLAGPGRSASPPRSDPASASGGDARHWERQSVQLNTSLYLAALLLGTNLLFIHAFLRWPSFLLADPQGRNAYVDTMVSFYGFSFSSMLAAYYIPVAALLAVRAQKDDGGLPEAFKGPTQIVKIVLGLSSTAFAGALPDILDLVTGS